MIEVVSGFKFTDSTDPLDGRNNFPTIADMKACEICDEGHITFCKATGKSYRFVSKNTDGTSKTKDNTYGYWEEFEGTGTVTDVKVKEKSSDSYTSVLNNGIAQIDLSKKLELTDNKSLILGNTNNTTSKDSIASGVGVNITGDRSFGFGEAYTSIYLTGDTSSNVYTAKLFSKTKLDSMKKVADVFKITHVNAYILETTNFTRVAKITAINWTDENNPLTVTLDTNLGVLTDGQYCIENIGGAKSFSVGTFGNTGTNSTVFGNGNYNTGNYSLVSGYQNTNKSNYSNVLGYWNKNAEAGASVMGYANKNAGQYPVVLGLENDNSGNYSVLLGKRNVNKCAGSNIIGYGNTVNETTYPSNILGMDNIVDTNAQSFILGYSNHGTKGTYSPSDTSCTFILGHDLTTSRGGIALGWYNKDYDVETQAKQNFLVVGQGTKNQPLNTIEQKANGDLYVFGIGNFNGTNSDNANIKTLQTVISELNSGGGGSLSDVKVINYSNLSTSVVTGGIAEIDLSYINFDQNNTITIGKSNNNNSSLQSINIGKSNTLFKDKTISIGNNNLSMRAAVLPNNTILIGNNLIDDVSVGCNSGLSVDASTPSRNESAIILGRNNCKYTFGYYRDGVFEIGTGGTSDTSGKSVLALRDTGDLYLKGVGNWDGLHDLNGNTKSINSYLADIENSKTLSVLESNKFYNFMSLPFVDIYIHTVASNGADKLFEIYTTSGIELQEIAEYIWITRTGTQSLKRDTINLSNSDETLEVYNISSDILGIIPRWKISKDNVTALNSSYISVRS